MAYKNVTGIFGHEWISEAAVNLILKELPESHYKVWVRFTDDKNDILLKDCTRKERNLDCIVIEYKDGTNRLDPDPYIRHIDGPVNPFNVVYDSSFGALAFFSRRCKEPMYPLTRNEDPKDIKRMRQWIRHKLAGFLQVSEVSLYKDKDGPLDFAVNFMDDAYRARLIRLLENLDYDGAWITVNVNFPYATIDQLQRLDNEMELIKVGEEFEMSEQQGEANEF